MKVTLLLTLITALNTFAISYSQDSKLNLSIKDKALIDVIRVIEQQSKYRFFFSDNYQDLSNLVSVNIKDGNINNVLSNLFADKAITYKVLENNIIVIIPSENLAQQQTISGTVTDATTGDALPGVNIIVEGTTVGVTTDINGKYSIVVDNANASLVFSFIGYVTQKVAAQGSVIDIIMVPDVKKIDEVVVVGYGTMKKLDVSGSIVSTNSSVIREIPSTNAAAALQGRLPGIEMSQVSTRPGAIMQIRIRGERSLNADNSPLIVVDGIPFQGSLNDIAPSDIKSIDILKDASSTAIYGSRGSNGVILVTTFRGNLNTTASVTYNGYYGIKTVSKKYPVYNGTEYQAFKHATTNASYKDTYTPLEQQMIAAGKETDWQDLMYDNAMVTNHDIGVSAGSPKGAYTLGTGYYKETAVLPGQDYTRYSIRATADQEIGKYVKVGLSTQNAYGITNGESASIMNNILTLSPLMPAYNDDGSIRIEPSAGHVDKYYNPLLLNNENAWGETRKRFSTFNSLYAEVKITEAIKYRVNLGLSYYQENYGRYYGSESPFQAGSVSTATVQNKNFSQYTIENLLYFDKVFAEKHRINATLMYSAEQSEYIQSGMSADNLSADYSFWYNLGLSDGTKTIAANAQNYWKQGLISMMGRVLYAFNDRYTFTGTYRRDGASVLAEGHKWHDYAAFSAGWNIHDEAFLKNVSAISQLKLRIGYGQTSNRSVQPYATLGGLTQVPYNFGSTNLYGAYVTDLPNSDLGWEYTKNYNIGIDFGFLDNRISGYLEIYQQKTNDVLYQVSLPQSSGVSNPVWQNIGATQNKGFEFSVTAQIFKPKEKGGFGWDIDFNIYANRNKITALQAGVTESVGNGFFLGQPINVIYDYEKLGIIQESEAPYLGTYAAGKIKIADLVEDGKITGEDRKILGSFEPDFAGGFSTRFNYKNFDLSVVSFFKSGGLLVSTMHMPHSYLSTNDGRRNSIKVDYWTPEHPTGTYPQPGNQGTAEQDDFGSTLGYFSASFLKVRTITLGYTFDSKLINTIGCKEARIYFTCQNPFTLFSPYMDAGGVDPEATGTGPQGANASLTGGITSRALTIGANTPPTRNFLIGVSVKF